CTGVFALKPWRHPSSPSTLQLMPAGLLVTVPTLSLDSLTPSVNGLNCPTTVVTSSSAVTVQGPMPGQSGALRRLIPSAVGFAVSSTGVPRAKPQWHSPSPSLFVHGPLIGVVSLPASRSNPGVSVEIEPGPRGATSSVTSDVALRPPPAETST